MKQHFLPRFYLKNWKVKINHRDNQIWIYEKNVDPYHDNIDKNVGHAINFYAYDLEDGTLDNISIEKQLSAIESNAAPIFVKIKNKEPIKIEEKEKLAEFISIFWRRTPFHKQWYEGKLQEFIPEYFSERYEDLRNLGVDETHPRFIEIQKYEKQYLEKPPAKFFAENVVRDTIITETLVQMDWAFIVAPRDTKFATSDNPFVFSRGAGLGNVKYGHALFPLTPEIVLQATSFTDFGGQYEEATTDVHAREVNKRIVSNAHNQVFWHKKSEHFGDFVTKWIGAELDR